MKQLSFRVEFPPTPWKRPAGGKQRYDSQAAEKSALSLLIWKELQSVLPAVSKDPFFQKDLPLAVKLHFGMERKGKMTHPTCKNDVDNLSKFVMDTLQSGSLGGRVWHDDGQVVHLESCKFFSNEPYIFCSIWEIS
jgi:Holliday junction resolvase RusA-like endonuclease